MLKRYEQMAKTMTVEQLEFTIDDVSKTIKLRNDLDSNHPYKEKLFAEFDAYTVELSKRQNNPKILKQFIIGTREITLSKVEKRYTFKIKRNGDIERIDTGLNYSELDEIFEREVLLSISRPSIFKKADELK